MNIYVGNLNYRVREDDLKQVMYVWCFCTEKEQFFG